MERCMNQIFKTEVSFRFGGNGDCKTCIPDEKNIHCTGYRPAPIKIWTFLVEEPQQVPKDRAD